MSGPLRLELLTAADLGRVHDLWTMAGLPFRPEGRDSLEAMAAELGSTRTFILGVLAGRLLVGVAVGTDDGRKGWINRVAVLPEQRRQGVGRLLVDGCEAIFRERGLGLSCALVEEDNEGSRALFRSEDYVERRDVIYHRKTLRGDAY